jgi:hypothetical protein
MKGLKELQRQAAARVITVPDPRTGRPMRFCLEFTTVTGPMRSLIWFSIMNETVDP